MEIKKIDDETGEILTGGRFSIREKETGIIITSFMPEGKPVLIKGLLTAGTTYELVEEEPPAGYAYSKKSNLHRSERTSINHSNYER
uniref:SpaA isopeptide-forming pilin-related protein n=1 Tax=Clostridium sp. NkU-1 TaxID=1095009 RepID=UPI00326192B7